MTPTNIDRLLRYVICDKTFVNYELVLGGYAYAKSYRPDTACDAVLDAAEKIAEEYQVGTAPTLITCVQEKYQSMLWIIKLHQKLQNHNHPR